MKRRKLVVSLITAGTVAIAGCSGSETQSAEQQREFSTTGNDSQLIQSPVDELTLTTEDLPGSDWEQEQDESGADATFAMQAFSKPTPKSYVGVLFNIRKKPDVSAAKDGYEPITPEYLIGSSVREAESRELNVGVASELYSWDGENGVGPGYLIKIRDANVFCHLFWTVRPSDGEYLPADPVSLDQMGQLAVTIHTKWR
ncbi:hypothetical protein [Haloquadratum walsbyi]|jgi:hypothetical protein|nr:hypothetical protein [Haloquadratum walsbyi]